MRRGSIPNNAKPVEFVPDSLYYMPIAGAPPCEKDNERVLYFSIDDKLHYNNFYLDFEPLNLGCTIQFTTALTTFSPSPKSHVAEITQGDNLLQIKQSYQHRYVR
ncbi:Cell cycle protein cdc14, partial [Globisporangium splendens]